MPTTASDEDGFERLLATERRRLYGIANSILRDQGEAEDALQEAMLRAWNAWPQLRDQERGSAWLTTICVRHCINRRRGRIARMMRSATFSEGQPAREDKRFQGRLVDLDRGYLRLSTRQRAAVSLHYHHGYSVDECARLMRCSAGSVRTHLARSIVTLRKEMTNA